MNRCSFAGGDDDDDDDDDWSNESSEGYGLMRALSDDDNFKVVREEIEEENYSDSDSYEDFEGEENEEENLFYQDRMDEDQVCMYRP